jgi:Rrf2 family protein
MKISSQEEYGLRCLIQVAKFGTENPVPISEIASLEGLSVEYVGKLLMKLRKGGLVESVRGKAGGYVPAMPPEEISLRLVLDVLSEPMYDPSYCERFSGTEESCVHLAECSIRPIWSVVNKFVAQALSRITLADVIESEVSALSRLSETLAEEAASVSRKSLEEHQARS